MHGPFSAPNRDRGRAGMIPAPAIGLRTGAVAVLVGLVAVGCATTTAPPMPAVDTRAGIVALEGPAPADLAALYRIQVPGRGRLRMAVLTSGDAGRLTVTEPFGSAVSITAWDGDRVRLYDFERDCAAWIAGDELLPAVRALSPERAVRLLAGRLPAAPADVVAIDTGGRVAIRGAGAGLDAALAPDPWRVASASADDGSWSIEVRHHTGALPAVFDVRDERGRRVGVELLQFEWSEARELPDLPDLPPCP